MPKLSKLRKALRSQEAMRQHLIKNIGFRSRSTILGLEKQDDANILNVELVLFISKKKSRGQNPFGGKPKCCKINQ